MSCEQDTMYMYELPAKKIKQKNNNKEKLNKHRNCRSRKLEHEQSDTKSNLKTYHNMSVQAFESR